MDTRIQIFKCAAIDGLKKGLSGYLWMLKILIPISFCTLLIDYSGVITKLDFLLVPLMGFLSLPPEAALPLIIGLLTGIYGAVASMMVLPLAPEHMTLVAIFLLISHNLIQEGIIQKQAGFNIAKATLFRLSGSVITVIISARFLKADIISAGRVAGVTTEHEMFTSVMLQWAVESAHLCIKIFVLIMAIMVLLEVMKAFSVIPHITRIFRPVFKIMGIDQEVGVLWLTAGIFGLTYGSAVIVEETRGGGYSEEALGRLHLSIGFNHAMIEDPALFLPLGLSAFWLWVPRIVAAIVVVQLMNIWIRIVTPRKPVEYQK